MFLEYYLHKQNDGINIFRKIFGWDNFKSKSYEISGRFALGLDICQWQNLQKHCQTCKIFNSLWCHCGERRYFINY